MSNFGERWETYRPTKATWFWSCSGVFVATLIVGFTWGGWVTGATAREMTEEAAQNARVDLAAAICVDRYMAGDDVAVRLTALKDESSWSRGNMIEEGIWAVMPDRDGASDDVADACAERLATMEPPAATEAAATPPA